jgi:methylmalonyl-CoA mutase
MLENLPGRFPFTAGVFPFKRDGERPGPHVRRRGRRLPHQPRFHLLSEGQPATRLSTAFDSVTLYGFDPDVRPDIYGKVGNSGVSIATLDDMKVAVRRVRPVRSVDVGLHDHQRPGTHDPRHVPQHGHRPAPRPLPADEGREPTADEAADIRAWVLANVRGTVQADILKEDQGQNTCIFSTEFALGMMADIAEWFVAEKVRNFYSVSISGYHIAEAGANPISQLAFTLANGFTYVEAYLARGMDIDDFAPNLSFFFSNGMDPEYTVLGRVARRIWAVAMRDRYGADERSQKLKYHVQTSGRSLHAQEMAFNDIRTTLQALIAIYDNCNSLHTNAYDEAVTTPTEESVRRALAIQLVINEEWGLAMNENPNQGSFIDRRAHRPGRGGGARRVRPHRRARRRARRHGDRLPARPHPGRVAAVRDPQARRHAADHRRQHLPPAAPEAGDEDRSTSRSSWPAPPTTRSSPSSAGSRTFHTAHADDVPPPSPACKTPPSPATTSSRC